MCLLPGGAPWASIPGKHTDAGTGGAMETIHYWLKCLGGEASFFLPWTPPPGPACRGEPWCCEACADGPPESTHPARCLRTRSTPAEPGRWRSTASEGEEAPKRREKFSFVKLSASVLASQARFPFFRSLGLFAPPLQRVGSAVSPRSRGVGRGQRLHLSGWADSAALVFGSRSRRHPPSVPCASCRSCCQWR